MSNPEDYPPMQAYAGDPPEVEREYCGRCRAEIVNDEYIDEDNELMCFDCIKKEYIEYIQKYATFKEVKELYYE
jgi:hypothetical protein